MHQGGNCRLLHHLIFICFPIANFSSTTASADRPSPLLQLQWKAGDPVRSASLWWRVRGAPGGPGHPPHPTPPACTLTFSQQYEVTSEEECIIIFFILFLSLFQHFSNLKQTSLPRRERRRQRQVVFIDERSVASYFHRQPRPLTWHLNLRKRLKSRARVRV